MIMEELEKEKKCCGNCDFFEKEVDNETNGKCENDGYVTNSKCGCPSHKRKQL
jgi:hypothetical protein